MRTGADGMATVQTNLVKTGTFAAQLSATSATGSYAYLRQTLSAAQTELNLSGDFQITTEGASGANVPLFRLFDPSGTRLISLYRQNLNSDKIWIQVGGTNLGTTGKLPLNTWGQFQVHIITAGAASTVEVRLNGTLIYQTTSASLGSAGVLNVQIGNDTTKQTFTLAADNILVTS